MRTSSIRPEKKLPASGVLPVPMYSSGKKKGLQVLYSQPFNFVIRIVLYVLCFPAAAAVYHRRLGLLLLCWWYIAVVAIVRNLPGTIGLPLADGQVFTIRHYINRLAPCLGSG
jgi:hypothetical protein